MTSTIISLMITFKLIGRVILFVIFTSLLSLDVGLTQSADDYVAKGRAKFEKGDYKERYKTLIRL